MPAQMKRDLLGVFADVPHELVEGSLHAVAEADRADLSSCGDGLHVHAHRDWNS